MKRILLFCIVHFLLCTVSHARRSDQLNWDRFTLSLYDVVSPPSEAPLLSSDAVKQLKFEAADLVINDTLLGILDHGLLTLGNPATIANQKLRAMLSSVIARLATMNDEQQAQEIFWRLVHATEENSEIQRQVITLLYAQIISNTLLEPTIYLATDKVKQDWLGKTIFHFEKRPTKNPNLINGYIKTIESGIKFGLSWHDFALADAKAKRTHHQADLVFASYIDAEQIFYAVWNELKSANFLAHEIQAVLSKYNNDITIFFDNNSIINENGISTILQHFSIMHPAPDDYIKTLMANQTELARALFAADGRPWEQIEQQITPHLGIGFPEFELAHWSSQEYRLSILENGLLNQFETGTSGGFYGPGRAAFERSRLNMTTENYTADLPRHWRPKFVKIVSPTITPVTNSYGSDIFILKKQDVLERLSFTFGGSAQDCMNKMKRGGIKYANNEPRYPHNWTDIYLPWNQFRLLLFPYMDQSMNIRQQSAINLGMTRPTSRENFVEGQIFGPVLNTSIESFIFTNRVPHESELASFAELQIEVIDGRSGSRTPHIHYQRANTTCTATKFTKNGPQSDNVHLELCEIPSAKLLLRGSSFSGQSELFIPSLNQTITVGTMVYVPHQPNQAMGTLNRFVNGSDGMPRYDYFVLRTLNNNFHMRYYNKYYDIIIFETNQINVAVSNTKEFTVGEVVKLNKQPGYFTLHRIMTHDYVLVYSNNQSAAASFLVHKNRLQKLFPQTKPKNLKDKMLELISQ